MAYAHYGPLGTEPELREWSGSGSLHWPRVYPRKAAWALGLIRFGMIPDGALRFPERSVQLIFQVTSRGLAEEGSGFCIRDRPHKAKKQESRVKTSPWEYATSFAFKRSIFARERGACGPIEFDLGGRARQERVLRSIRCAART